MAGIVTRLMELAGADGASLSTIDDEFAYFQVCEGADAPLQGQTLPLAETLGTECIARGDVTVLRATTGPRSHAASRPEQARSSSRRSSTTARSAASSACAAPTLDAFDENERRDAPAARRRRVDRAAERRARRAARAASGSTASCTPRPPTPCSSATCERPHPRRERCRRVAPRVLGRRAARDARRPRSGRPAELRPRRPLRNDELLRARRAPGRAAVPPEGRQRARGRVLEPRCSTTAASTPPCETSRSASANEERLRSSLERSARDRADAAGDLGARARPRRDHRDDRRTAPSAWPAPTARRCSGSKATTPSSRHCSGIAAPMSACAWSARASLAGLAARRRRAGLRADTRPIRASTPTRARALGARSLICAPLYRDGAGRRRALDPRAASPTRSTSSASRRPG